MERPHRTCLDFFETKSSTGLGNVPQVLTLHPNLSPGIVFGDRNRLLVRVHGRVAR